MRTVVAVTAPVVAAGPNALTQSPTARSVAAELCVAATVVALVVVILKFSVLGFFAFVFVLVDLLELVDSLGRTKLPGERSNPETERVDPLTAFTLPVAMAKDPRLGKFRPDPGVNDGRVPPFVPPAPDPKRKPPAPGPVPPPVAPPPPNRDWPVHDPVEDAATTEMLRAAIVVFDDFDGVPVTVTQSPEASELTASVTDLEKIVVGVQLTVVCPVLGLCTSMVEPERAATLPLAPPGALAGAVAAPAVEAIVVAVTSATAPLPMNRPQRRLLVLRLVGVSMS